MKLIIYYYSKSKFLLFFLFLNEIYTFSRKSIKNTLGNIVQFELFIFSHLNYLQKLQ